MQSTRAERCARLLVKLAVFHYRQLPFTTTMLLAAANWDTSEYYLEENEDIRLQVQAVIRKLEMEAPRSFSTRPRIRLIDALEMLKKAGLPFLIEDVLQAADCGPDELQKNQDIVRRIEHVQNGSIRARVQIALEQLQMMGQPFDLETLARNAQVSRQALHRNYADLLTQIKSVQKELRNARRAARVGTRRTRRVRGKS